MFKRFFVTLCAYTLSVFARMNGRQRKVESQNLMGTLWVYNTQFVYFEKKKTKQNTVVKRCTLCGLHGTKTSGIRRCRWSHHRFVCLSDFVVFPHFLPSPHSTSICSVVRVGTHTIPIPLRLLRFEHVIHLLLYINMIYFTAPSVCSECVCSWVGLCVFAIAKLGHIHEKRLFIANVHSPVRHDENSTRRWKGRRRNICAPFLLCIALYVHTACIDLAVSKRLNRMAEMNSLYRHISENHSLFWFFALHKPKMINEFVDFLWFFFVGICKAVVQSTVEKNATMPKYTHNGFISWHFCFALESSSFEFTERKTNDNSQPVTHFSETCDDNVVGLQAALLIQRQRAAVLTACQIYTCI